MPLNLECKVNGNGRKRANSARCSVTVEVVRAIRADSHKPFYVVPLGNSMETMHMFEPECSIYPCTQGTYFACSLFAPKFGRTEGETLGSSNLHLSTQFGAIFAPGMGRAWPCFGGQITGVSGRKQTGVFWIPKEGFLSCSSP